MALKTWKCLTCEQEFTAGQWACAGGENHVVASKAYFMDDAPTVPDKDGRIDKHSTTQVLNIPPERSIKVGNDVQRVPGGSVTFVRGRYDTSDPEQQYHLDRKAGLCNEERWKAVYFSAEEKQQIRAMDLDARERRIESHENELLAMAQKKVVGKEKTA